MTIYITINHLNDFKSKLIYQYVYLFKYIEIITTVPIITLALKYIQYKIQTSVNSISGVILDCYVTNSGPKVQLHISCLE